MQCIEALELPCGFCADQSVGASVPSSRGFQAPCPRGTQRDRFGVCRRGYIG